MSNEGEDRAVYEEISEKRRKLVLFILDAVIFGFVLSALSWVIPIFVPSSWASIILALCILLLIFLGWLTFKLIVPPMRIRETVFCCFIQNMKEGSVVVLDLPVWYQFSVVGAEAFTQLVERKPEYKEKLKESLDPKDKILRDFGIFAIIEWLAHLGAISISFAGYRRPPPVVIYKGLRKVGELPKGLLEENVFLSSIQPTFPISIPKNVRIQLENGAVILNDRLMKITIAVNFSSWSRGVDLRLQHLLHISDEERMNYGTMVGRITFDAEFKAWSMFSPKADKYYTFAKEMLENLRLNYGWSEYIEDLKESVFWKHILK